MEEDNKPTMRQMVLFGVILSFIVSVLGTILTLSVAGPLLGKGDITSPIVFNRSNALQKLTEVVTERQEKVLRQDELVVKLVEDASPAVVSIVASKDVPVIEQYFVDPFSNDPFFQQFFGGNGSGVQVPQYRQKGTEKRDISSGTGFFVSADGLILTNKHVVADQAAEYTVFLNDKKKLQARVLARDPVQDLAVLKVDGTGYPVLKLGNSSRVKIGQTVVAIGNALGEFSNTVSVGIISGLQRTVVASDPNGSETLQELIQTDAAINPGNSGGPLLNLDGEVIGINTAIAQGAQNIGFALPINKARRDIDSVQKEGRIIYPFLGILYAPITPELAEKEKLAVDHGILLRGDASHPAVQPGSPAEQAGLKEGDIILSINVEPVQSDVSFASLIQKYNVGDQITLRVWRAGKEFDVKVKLAERK